jgi:3-hydroxyacyl-CoA dehydrogenase
MGAGIAGHLANLGMSVTLVDTTRERAQEGIERVRLAQPPIFMRPETAALIETLSLSDADSAISNASWVCEAIVERLDAKQEILARVDALASVESMISSNTSGLPISELIAGRSESFRKRFVGAHFFNPPRYLKLLELIPTTETDPAEVARIRTFLEAEAARRVVLARDTPGFIANRFGMWALFQAIKTAEELHLSVEVTDLIAGEFIGRPRSGVFRLADIIGIDVMVDIARGLRQRLPHDPHGSVLDVEGSVLHLLSHGWLGNKTGHGYYRKQGSEFLAFDVTTGAYRMHQDAAPPLLTATKGLPLKERLAAALDSRDEVGEFVRSHLVPTLRYAESIKDQISHSVQDIDRVMRWGFGWQLGPFELIDALEGKAGFTTAKYYEGARYRAFDGTMVNPPAEPEFEPLSSFPVVDVRPGLNVRDLGDGVLALATTTKMGVITPELVEAVAEYLKSTKDGRFVFTSESKAFSVGYDLNVFAEAIDKGNFESVDNNLAALQNLGALLSQHRVVAAIFGYALGAGLELALGCGEIVAAAESKIGLPESRVGLIPGGRGTVLMRLLGSASAKKLAEILVAMAEGRVVNSAPEARATGYLRSSDRVIFNADRLLWEAKQSALKVELRPMPNWSVPAGPLTGMIDQGLAAKRAKGDFSDYDMMIAERLKAVFVRSKSYEDALDIERAEFVDLIKRPFTQARIRHMLENGKPLRN